MGVESYFVSVKVNRLISIDEWIINLSKNNYKAKRYYEFYNSKFLGIRKKRLSSNDILVNDIVVISKNNDYRFSLIACFSCYEKSINLICNLVATFNTDIDYLYYGKNIFNNDINCLSKWITNLQKKRYMYFLELFGEISLDIPPNEFYYMYRKCKNN